MPQIRFAKSEKIENIKNDYQNNENKSYAEDKLYIFKETDKIGRLFYNTDTHNQIEIGSLDNIYCCTEPLNRDIEDDIDIKLLTKFDKNGQLIPLYLQDTESYTDDIDYIKINSFIISEQSIYNIRNIDRQNKKVTAARFYALSWNDYYE